MININGEESINRNNTLILLFCWNAVSDALCIIDISASQYVTYTSITLVLNCTTAVMSVSETKNQVVSERKSQ